MGFLLELFSLIFLIIGTVAQLISYMTPNMYENKFIVFDHQGLFRRCGLYSTANSPTYLMKKLVKDPHNVVNSLFGAPSSINGCYWWDFEIFKKEPSKSSLIIINVDNVNKNYNYG